MLPFAGFTNSTNEVFQKADSLFSAFHFEWASTEYERIAWNAQDNLTRTNALLKKSECQLSLGKSEDAYKTTNRIFYSQLPDSLHYQSRYKTALYAYISKEFELAESQLLLIDQFLPDTIAINSYYLYALTLNELRKWDEAKSKLNTWSSKLYSGEQLMEISANIDSLYNEENFPKYKDPSKAQIMSSIVPGLGQLYTGNVLDAAFNATMVLVGIGVGVYGIVVLNYYVTGAILGYGIFQRFYQAGGNRAEFLANKYNYDKKREYNDSLRSAILEFEK